jgi:hypothetical protein
MYELAKRTMVNDIATFEAAVARADVDGEILYVPGQGFTTITAADRKRADRATTVAAFYEVETLALLGITSSDTPLDDVVSARFHAHPFTDPLTQLDDTLPMALSPFGMKQPLQPARICQGVCGSQFENADFDPASRRPKMLQATRQTILDRAPKTADGDYLDPNNPGLAIPQEGPFDLGHIPGSEWWRTQEWARSQNRSREDVIASQKDPTIFRVEDPSSNRSRRHEQPK